MKTLTEFSGTLIRMAARAVAEARKLLPKDSFVSAVPAPEGGVTAQPSETATPAAPVGGADSPTDATDQALANAEGSGGPVENEAAGGAKVGEAGSDEEGSSEDPDAVARAEEKDADQDLSGAGGEGEGTTVGGARTLAGDTRRGESGSGEEAESEQARAALDEAVGTATGMTGDRLARLREAVRVAGRQSDRVRLVRVFGSEEEVAGAKKIGEFQYVIDLMPASMKQTFKDPKDDKNKPRGPRKSMGGPKQKEGSLEGSFSMESVAQDRKSERGGPGGGRGGAGGGRGGPGGGRGGPGGGRGGPGGGRGGPGGGRSGGSPSKP